MARVLLWGSLRPAAGGAAELEVDAANVGELISRLRADYPEMVPLLDRGISVSIDGRIYAVGSLDNGTFGFLVQEFAAHADAP